VCRHKTESCLHKIQTVWDSLVTEVCQTLTHKCVVIVIMLLTTIHTARQQCTRPLMQPSSVAQVVWSVQQCLLLHHVLKCCFVSSVVSLCLPSMFDMVSHNPDKVFHNDLIGLILNNAEAWKELKAIPMDSTNPILKK